MLARIVIFFAAISPLTNSGPAFCSDQEAYARAAASVVRVTAAVPGRGSSIGSGVALPDGRVVTNCHVTRGAQSLAVTDATELLLAEPNDSDFAADLCVLTTGILTARPAQLGSSSSLSVGDEVAAIGFSGGAGKSLSRGYITALFPYRGGYVIRTSAAFSPGASGGGLFDRDGRLVGIITFFRRGADEYSFFAIPAEWIGTLPYSAASANPDTIPFWMRKNDDQPRFLQVAAFEADRNWQGVARAARAWVKDEPGEVQAWETLVHALRKTGEPMDITVALEGTLTAPTSLIWSGIHQGRLPVGTRGH
jgi:hypothetical protein